MSVLTAALKGLRVCTCVLEGWNRQWTSSWDNTTDTFPRVSSRIFQLGGGGGGGPASLASQILYLITTLGKSLTRPFPDVDILLLQ